jgi:hypothetical protein
VIGKLIDQCKSDADNLLQFKLQVTAALRGIVSTNLSRCARRVPQKGRRSAAPPLINALFVGKHRHDAVHSGECT